MFRYAKNVRLVSFLQQAFQMALTGFLPVSLWLWHKKVIPTSLCSSSNAVHCSLAVRSCKEVVDYLQVLNSKKFWEASDGVEEEALFEVLGGAIREKVQDGDGGILQKEL